jgi:hypothetical protein
MNRALKGMLLLLCVAALGGCGESFAELSGKVTLNDKPLPGGTVVFATEDGSKMEQVAIKPDGTYSSNKIPYGNLRVGVLPPAKSPGDAMPKNVKLPPGIPADHPQAKIYLQAAGGSVDIPPALRDPAKSNITVKVDGSQKTFDIPLKS